MVSAIWAFAKLSLASLDLLDLVASEVIKKQAAGEKDVRESEMVALSVTAACKHCMCF